MNKLGILLSFISGIILLFSGCKKDSLCNCTESTGSQKSEIRLMSEFTAIDLYNNVDVVLKYGTEPQVKVTCGKNLMDGIKTEVRDGVLYIRNKNKCNWLRDFENKFVVEVTYSHLKHFKNNGSGNVNCADTIKSPEFQLDSWNGAGTLSFLVDCNAVQFKLHTGPADLYASGKVVNMYVYTAGNGFVRIADVQCENLSITSSSTGDSEVFAINELGVSIWYHGDIYYHGAPTIVKTDLTSSGKLIGL